MLSEFFMFFSKIFASTHRCNMENFHLFFSSRAPINGIGLDAMRLPTSGNVMRIVGNQWSCTKVCQLAIQLLMETVKTNSEKLIRYLAGCTARKLIAACCFIEPSENSWCFIDCHISLSRTY